MCGCGLCVVRACMCLGMHACTNAQSQRRTPASCAITFCLIPLKIVSLVEPGAPLSPSGHPLSAGPTTLELQVCLAIPDVFTRVLGSICRSLCLCGRDPVLYYIISTALISPFHARLAGKSYRCHHTSQTQSSHKEGSDHSHLLSSVSWQLELTRMCQHIGSHHRAGAEISRIVSMFST